MVYKLSATKKIEELVDRVESICQSNKLAILHDYVYHDVVESKGFPIDKKVYIYEVCQAKVASAIVMQNADFAAFMPCRIAIYEDLSGVSISMQNMEAMFETLDKSSEVYSAAIELYERLKKVLKDIIS